MSPAPSPPDDVEAIADELVSVLVRLFRAVRSGGAGDDLVSKHDSPLGSPSRFQKWARAGRFPTMLRGRQLVARRADVIQAMEDEAARKRPKAAPASAPATVTPIDELAALRRERLRAMGALPPPPSRGAA